MTSEIVLAYVWDCIIVPSLGTLMLLPLFGPVFVILSVLLMVCVGNLYYFMRGILWK